MRVSDNVHTMEFNKPELIFKPDQKSDHTHVIQNKTNYDMFV